MRRNALLLTTLMILMSLSPFVQATGARSTACTGDVCINELMPNPMGTDTGNYPACEWVELYNSGTTDINLQGWTLVDAANYAHPIDANTWVDFGNLATPFVLAAGDYAIIAENSQGTLKLNNVGETLDLVNDLGNSVHSVTTGQASSDISKIPGTLATDDFVDSNTNTPGATNSGGGTGGPTYVQSELRITEVMPDPYWTNDNATWPGGEWIEIANIGSIAVDLAGWSVDDAAGNSMEMNTTHLVGSGTMIQPGQHRIIAVNGSRTYGMLNNGAGTEQIKLRMPSGEVTHHVEYSGPTRPGHSYVNLSSSTPDWGRNSDALNTAKWPTPESNNPLNTIIPEPQLQMNEVMINASSQDAVGGSWVELYYPSGEQGQNISDYLQGYVIRTGTGQFAQSSPESSVYQTDKFMVFGPVNLLHNYDSISLVDTNGDIRQAVEWYNPQQEDISIIPSDPMQVSGPWMQSPYNTPGTYNPGQNNGGQGNNTVDDVGLRISEFLPDPIYADSQTGMDGEWVEIVNNGNQSIDLTGWEIRSGSGFSLPPATLQPDAYMVYPIGEESITLTNNQGTLKLNNPDGNTTHTVIWDHSAYGMSMVPGVSPNDAWVVGAWPTPGEANLLFEQPYSGPNEILMSEVSPQCSSSEDGLESEWVELFNTAGYQVNLSRWMVQNDAGGAAAVAPGRLWNHTPNSMILDVGEYVVLNLEENILTNQGETITLLDPNGNSIQTLTWDTSTDCTTLESRDGGADTRVTLWPTPGNENPIIHSYDGEMTIKFTRFMPVEVSGRNNDWFEITNTGDTWVDLGGWVIERHTSDSSQQSMMLNYILEPGDSIVITEEPSNLIIDGGPEAVDADTLFTNSPPWLINSGGSLQLIAPDGTVVDAFVYGSGFAELEEGWNGLALEMPPSDGAGLILMRGDGCNVLPDTDTSTDWEYRWLRLGSSLFCDSGYFAVDGSVTPVNSPVGTLHQMVEWINGATTSLHLHVYQFDSPEIFLAIEAAVLRGVECTILLEGQILGDAADGEDQRGWAAELSDIGCTVLWMVEPDGTNAPMAPYRYIHSKVAVRDGDSVWIGSGNWKRSTFPLDADSGNRDSGVIVNSQDVANLVMSRMTWDENESQRHIINHDDAPSTTMGRPTGWIRPTASSEYSPNEPMPLTYDGPFGALLLTCPDDCIQSLVWMIDDADETLDISVQYFDLGWHWGYGDNPLIEAIERAANRSVSVRLLINGYYMDDGIRETVNHFNHRLNMTDGLPVEARIMAPSDEITKLHDKSMIVDGEWSLFSSINWGSNSALRNREMGIAIQHVDLAQHQTLIFEEDWNRLDSTTDTDGDGMPDYWEIENGLHRSWSAVLGSTMSEQNLDPDGDGLANLQEYQNGGDAQNPDTDGDCIHDGDEVMWAWEQSLDASLAVETPDADLDGISDNETVPCSNPEDEQQNNNNSNTNENEEEEAGPFRENAMESLGAKILLGFVIVAAISLLGALGLMLFNSRRESAGNVLVDDVGDISGEIWNEEKTDSPQGSVILDGTSVGPNAGSDAREVSVGRDDGVFGAPQLDGYNFPNWSPQQVQESLDAGWTVEQLREKYDSENK